MRDSAMLSVKHVVVGSLAVLMIVWGVVTTAARQATPFAATPAADPCYAWLSGTPEPEVGTHDDGELIVAPFDLVFLDALISHVEGSAALADIAAVRAEHEELRQASPAIAAALRDEIAGLRGLRQQWYPDAPPVPLLQTVSLLDEAVATSGATADSGMGEANPLLAGTDAQALCRVSGGFDSAFIDLIIQRYYGDTGIAALAQERAEHPELREVAAIVRASREAGLVQFATWQASWRGDAATPPAP